MASSLVIRLGVDISALGRQLKAGENRLKRFGFKAERIGRELSTRVSLPIIGIGAAAVKTFADFDRLEKGLAALNGSAAGGAASFNRLNKIVLDTRTTLDLRTAALGAQRLQGAGLSAAFAERTIKQLGIAATVSGSAIDDVGGVLRQFTQIIGKGKIEQEDLNSILDRMPALGAVIQKEFGTKTAEGIRATGISMESFVERLVVAIEQNKSFQDVQGGLAKAFESFGNAVQTGIRPLGDAISKALNLEVNLARLADFIGRTSQAFADLGPGTQRFIIYTAAAVAAVGPLALGLGAAARAVPLLVSGFSLLLGPAGKLVGAFKLVGLALVQLGSGSIVQRVLGFVGVFAKQLGSLKPILLAITSPVGLVVGAIALLAGGFIYAYKNSQFFQRQIGRVAFALEPVIEAVKSLASRILPNLSISFSSVGSIFKTVFAAIGGGISVIIEGFLLFIENLTAIGSAISKLFSGDFSGAASDFANSALNPAVFIDQAKRLANAFSTTFTETLEGAPIKVKSFEIEDPGEGSAIRRAAGAGEAVVRSLSSISAINFDTDRSGLDALNVSLRAMAESSGLVEARIRSLKPVVQEDLFAPYREGLDVITERQEAFGGTYDALSEKINLTKNTINSLIEDGFTAQSGAVQLAIDELRKYNEEFEKLEALTTIVTSIGGAVAKLGNQITRNLENGVGAFKGLAKAAVFAARDIITAQIRIAVTTQIAKALTSVPFPFNLALAGAAGVAVESLAKAAITSIAVPFLAEGGITQGAGLFVAGEAGPEAIIPLSRLHEFMGGNNSNVNVTGRFELDGETLVAAIERSEPTYKRA